MTAIAWDGKTLAADRMTSDEWVLRTTRKIAMLRGHLVGCAGNAAAAREALAWFGRGALESDFPAVMRDKDDSPTMIVISPDRFVFMYQRSPQPIELLDEVQAIGSGADACIAAMLCGKTAAEAVAIAAQICRGVGRGVDTLAFDDEAP